MTTLSHITSDTLSVGKEGRICFNKHGSKSSCCHANTFVGSVQTGEYEGYNVDVCSECKEECNGEMSLCAGNCGRCHCKEPLLIDPYLDKCSRCEEEL